MIRILTISTILLASFSSNSFGQSPSETPKILYLISMPRSLTTVFERSMKSRGDLQIVHEPFWQVYYKNKQKVTDPKDLEKMNAVARNSQTFAEVLDNLDSLARDSKSSVFVKDFERTTQEGFRQNLEYVRRPDVQFVILFREPKKTLLSYLRMLRTLPETIQPAFNPQAAMSYRSLLDLYLFLKETKGAAPLLINADQLAHHPRETMTKVSEHFQIPFLEKALKWESGLQAEWHIDAQKWHDNVAQSNGFDPKREEAPGHLELNDLTSTEKQLFDVIYNENVEIYEQLDKLSNSNTWGPAV